MDSTDKTKTDEIIYPTEYLNSQNPSDLPPYELKLKVNTIIMLLRNLSMNDGLCNGTRLMILELKPNVIKAKILTGIYYIYLFLTLV